MNLAALFTANAAAPYAWSLVLAGAVVIASIIPLGAARSQADFTMVDFKAPRAMFDRLPDWGKRASWAHQNSFEAFSLHAPAALLALVAALQTGHLPPLVPVASLLQPALRLVYLGAYVGNLPPLRGLCWASALLCTAILYVEGLRALLQMV
ncbi:MAG: MAPEG family protein [Synechococcus sp.]